MLFDAFFLGERVTFLWPTGNWTWHACFLAHPKQGKAVITMKNTTCSKENVTF